MKKVIAVVDDEKDLNELMNRYLAHEGYEVRSFYTYQQASDEVTNEEIDLWLLDIMLDEGSGFELFEAIKKNNPNKPIVFISARDQELDRIIGLEKGGDDYITKPFNMKEMVLRINNIIRRFYHEDEKLEIDGYVIDSQQRKVYQDGEVIPLTTKEYELLVLFIHKRGVAFTRDEVLEKVWGDNFYGNDRVVDDTLRRLRKKMPELSIQTIYGYGYRLG